MTAIVSQAPSVRPTVTRAMLALTARDLRVMRRTSVMNIVRIILQPLLFVFVFAYILPRITAASGTGFSASPGSAISTIMIPGLVGSSMMMQSVASLVFPVVMELSRPGMIEDRALAPLPIHLIAVQRIAEAMIEGVLAGAFVFPAVLFVHARGQTPSIHVGSWPLLILVVLAGALFASSLGLFIGTIINPRQIQVLFTLVMFPAMMLGCVYFRWTALASIHWLQVIVLFNPMVYLNEGLRASLTPQLSHMPDWAFLLALLGGSALFSYVSVQLFVRRVTK